MSARRHWLEVTLGVTSAVVLFLMMMVTAVDVAGRYLFNRPLAGGFELTELMLAALIYCGLPLVSQRREHIVVDTLDPFLPPALKRGFGVFAELVCAAALGGLGYLIFLRAQRVADYGDTTSVLRLPLAPVAYLMAVMIAITALIHLWHAVRPPADGGGPRH
jgi:TRAP-type C4-dicarboxylate transport system permease small subunit